MTNIEIKQNRRNFFEAGQTAFRMGIYIGSNPYKIEPYRGQWFRGWKNAKRKFNAKYLKTKAR